MGSEKKVFYSGKEKDVEAKRRKEWRKFRAAAAAAASGNKKDVCGARPYTCRVRTKKEKCSLIECRNLIWASIMGFDFFSGGGNDESYQRKSLVSQTLILLF